MAHRLYVVYNPRPALEGAAVAAGLLLAEHVALYRWREHLPLPARYALGVAALGAGLAHAGAEREDLTAVRDAALITAVGGALVLGAHLVRWAHYRREETRHAIPRGAWVGGT